VQASQGEPRADLARVPDADKSFVDFISAQVGKIDVVNQIFVDIVDEYPACLWIVAKMRVTCCAARMIANISLRCAAKQSCRMSNGLVCADGSECSTTSAADLRG